MFVNQKLYTRLFRAKEGSRGVLYQPGAFSNLPSKLYRMNMLPEFNRIEIEFRIGEESAADGVEF